MQHDYDLANQLRSAFRSDLNAALSALASNNSGTGTPPTTYAYIWWADTTNNLLKQRNAANSGWIVRGHLDAKSFYPHKESLLTNVSDFSAVLDPGVYTVDDTVAATNAPSGAEAKGVLTVLVCDDTKSLTQLFTPKSSPEIYLRSGYNGGAFTSWVKLLASAPGTQLAGFRRRNLNGDFAVFQRSGTTSFADGAYCIDQWYVLAQSGSVTVAQQTAPENGAGYGIRLTQPDASAKRIGLATPLLGADIRPLRGMPLVLSGRVRCSVSQPIRYAILEHSGTVDNITRDVVNNWASGTYTPGNFFINVDLAVIASGSITPTANTWTDLTAITGTSTAMNNIIVLLWTEGTLAQNATLDVNRVQLEVGSYPTAFEHRSYVVELNNCKYFFERLLQNGATDFNWLGYQQGGANVIHTVQYLEKRIVPTVTLPVGGWATSNLTADPVLRTAGKCAFSISSATISSAPYEIRPIAGAYFDIDATL